jgi:hypothetical protein
MKTRRHHNNTGARQVKTGKTWDQVKAMARRLGVPFGPEQSLFLRPGLYLIDVTPEKTIWVAIPNDDVDRTLPLDRATEELMKPALAALRAHLTEARDVAASGD